MKIDTVIFDFDGTLADSEAIHVDVLKQALKQKLNIDVAAEEIEELAGMTYAAKIKHILRDKNIMFDEKEISKLAADQYVKMFDSRIMLRKGAKELLETISSLDLKIGLYSPNSRHVLETTLKKFNIKGYFQVVVSAEDVKTPKPDPEGYLLAAKKLKTEPEKCLVFEDTPTGFTSAKSAGMKVAVVYNPYLRNPQFPKADAFVKTFEGIKKDFFKKF